MKKAHGIIYAVASAVSFGIVPVFAVIAYNRGANAITTLFLRFLAASVILAGILLVRKTDFRISRKIAGRLAYISVVGYAATCITLFSSYNHISIGLATTLHFVYPAIVAVMSFFIFKEKLGPIKILSLMLSIVGVYILAGSKEASVSMLGAVLSLTSGVFYSIYTIELCRDDIKVMDGLLLTFYVSLFSAASILIYGAFTGELYFNIQPVGLFAILGLAIICTVLGMLAYLVAVQIIGPSDTAILSTFEPVTGVVLGILMFGEKLSYAIAAGSIMVFISVLLFSYSDKKNAAIVETEDLTERGI